MSGDERGYFKLWRAVFSHPTLSGDPYCRRSAWAWLIGEASWQTRIVVRSGVRVELKRGELAHSIRHLADQWGWTPSKAQRFLELLDREQMIARRGVMRGKETAITVIRIVNYEIWQGEADATETPAARSVGVPRQSSSRTPAGTKNPLGFPTDGFARWYDAYGKKKSRNAAERAFLKLQASGAIAFDALMAATQRHSIEWAAKPAAEQKFKPYPASWLNAGSYADEPDAQPKSGGAEIKPLRDPKTFSRGDWEKNFTTAQQAGWSEKFLGPPPGNPSCLAPSDLQAQWPRSASAS